MKESDKKNVKILAPSADWRLSLLKNDPAYLEYEARNAVTEEDEEEEA